MELLWQLWSFVQASDPEPTLSNTAPVQIANPSITVDEATVPQPLEQGECKRRNQLIR